MDLIEQIDSRLETLLKEGLFSTEDTLYQAAHYLLLAPGKRIRPLLTYRVAEMLSGNLSVALTAGSAIEFIHTYSLIHDDLPAMDNDDMRRGKPTLHRVYDEATAILVGDFLLTYAFQILSAHTKVSDRQKIELITTLAEAAGGRGMVGGQLLDIQGKTKNVSIEHLHSLKTAALFKAAFAFGAIIANSPIEIIREMGNIGNEFGLLFQLVDDLIDQDHPERNQEIALLAEQKYHGIINSLYNLPFNSSKIKEIILELFSIKNIHLNK